MKDSTIKTELTAEQEGALQEWAKDFKQKSYLRDDGDVKHAAAKITHAINEEQPENPITHEIAYGWLTGHDIPRKQAQYDMMVSCMGFKFGDEDLAAAQEEQRNSLQRQEQELRAKLKSEPEKTIEEVVEAGMKKWQGARPAIKRVQIREMQLREGWEKLVAELKEVEVSPLQESDVPPIHAFIPDSIASEIEKEGCVASAPGKGTKLP